MTIAAHRAPRTPASASLQRHLRRTLARLRAPRPPAVPGFRPELHGLRAVAVVLVVVYHVWFGRISGGVDVFFVITGFLLVGRLARAAAAGPLPLGRMWARNAARLLPATAAVLLGTLAVAAFVLPSGRLPQTLREVVASLLFVENWQLAADAVDYEARNNTSSVVQHFWSLSVQGQVLLLFPLLVAAVAAAGRGPRLRVRLAVTLSALTAASLAFSVALTAGDQPLAYFHTLTRLWEFGLGGLLALGISRIALPARTRAVLGWTGLVGLVACGAVLQVGAVFPGIAALWPTSCALLVLVAGTTGLAWGADRWLGTGPVRYLGDLSYCLYLWHWPLLMFVLVTTGERRAGLVSGLGVVAVSLALAAATHHLVERPSGTRLATAGLVTVLATCTTWYAVLAAPATVTALHEEHHPGALAISGALRAAPAEVAPPFTAVYDDWIHTEHWDCVPIPGAEYDTDTACTQPVEATPQRRIVVVGDSHAQQFLGALLPLAGHHGWQVTSMLKGACPLNADAADVSCRRWNDVVLAEIDRLRPDAVVTIGTRDVRPGLTEELPSGYLAQWERLGSMGMPVVAVRDNPRFPQSPPDCLQLHGRENPACGVPRDAVYAPEPPWMRVPLPANVGFLDTADLLCDAELCPAEAGNVLVYMDDNHLSGTYAATMAPLLDQPLRDLLGW
ncbi:MAG: acyltransferase family protein [Pseudonocardia sp.]